MDVAAGDRFRRGWMRRMPRRFPWRARAVVGRFRPLASRPSTKKTCPSSSQSCGGSTFRSGAASHAGTACRAGTRCKPPTPWARQAYSSVLAPWTFTVLLHKHVGVPLEKIATLLQDRFGLTVTPGGLAQVLHRAARVAAPTYAALCAQIRGSPVVSPDETGWRVGAVLHWLWAFATPETTVYAIRPGRSFDDAVTILGADFAGVLVRDGWAPYRRFTGALHQSCLAHLFRRCRTLRADHPRSPWAARVQAVLTDALALRDRRDAHAITEQGLAGARGRLLARLGRLIDTAPALPAAQRFARHLDREFPAVLAFLWAPDVDATNWRAEHAIRPAVVNRKICGGNRTPRGARTQQVLASVVRTARQRHVDLDDLFTSLLRAPRSMVPAAFRLPTL